MTCEDCADGMVDGVRCATCEPEIPAEPGFVVTYHQHGGVTLVRADIPSIANVKAFEVNLSREELRAIVRESMQIVNNIPRREST